MKHSHRFFHISREEILLMFGLIWPCILENMTATLVSLVDTAMVGSIGAVATAAVGLCTSPTWMLNGLARSLGVGGTAIVARAIGAGNKKEASYSGSQVFRMAFLMAFFFALFTFFGAPVIPRLMRGTPEVCENAALYLRVISFGYLFHYCAMTMGALLRGAGDTRTPMLTGIAANIINVVGNFLLIYPSRTISFFGLSFPMWGAGLGIKGAAIASALSIGGAGLFLLCYMFTKKSALRIHFSLKDPLDLKQLKRVLKIAWPAAAERFIVNLGQIIYASMFASIGTAHVAAYHITCTIESLGYMPANGFAAAATTMVGQKLGAKDPDGAQRLGNYTIWSSIVFLSIVGTLMAVLRYPLAGVFTNDTDVHSITVRLIIICAMIQPFNAFSIVTQGALNGAGDTLRPLIYSLLTMWGIRIVFSFYLGFHLHYGVYGIYFSMLIDLAVRSLMLQIRFLHGKWKTAKV